MTKYRWPLLTLKLNVTDTQVQLLDIEQHVRSSWHKYTSVRGTDMTIDSPYPATEDTSELIVPMLDNTDEFPGRADQPDFTLSCLRAYTEKLSTTP